MTGRNYEKMKQAELKAELKVAGMTLAGDKGTQSWRLKQRDICVAKGLKTYDGTPIYKLLGSKLVKACAKEGVSCIGTCMIFRELYLYSISISFHIEWFIRQLWCSSIISCNITNMAHNHYTNITLKHRMIRQQRWNAGTLGDPHGREITWCRCR